MIFWLIIVVSTLIGLGVAGLLYWRDRRDFRPHRGGSKPSWPDYTLRALVIGPCIGIAVATLACAIIGNSLHLEAKHHKPERAKILSLNDHLDTEAHADGFFVLAVGGYSMDEETTMNYSFWQETKDGSFFRHTISSDYDTTIRIHFIPDGAEPYVERTDPAEIYETPGWVAPFDFTSDENTHKEIQTLYVPKDTIKYQNVYEIDEK